MATVKLFLDAYYLYDRVDNVQTLRRLQLITIAVSWPLYLLLFNINFRLYKFFFRDKYFPPNLTVTSQFYFTIMINVTIVILTG